MIINFAESDYRGFHIEHVKGKGWKCNFAGRNIIFPHEQAAKDAVDIYWHTIREIKKMAIEARVDLLFWK